VENPGPVPARRVPPGWWKRRAVEVAGWLLVAAGLAALVLPGPGLLFLVAGLAVLSLRYPRAKRLLVPVRARAIVLATRGVATWPRMLLSALLGLALVALGIVWGIGPPSTTPKSGPTT
jgi:hypothetical protein